MLSLINAQPEVNGYIQSTMIKSDDNKAFVFDFDRVRIGAKGTLNPLVDYKFQIDATSSASAVANDGESPGIITFAEIIYKLNDNHRLSVGKYKTPIGMEWNAAATSLDFA